MITCVYICKMKPETKEEFLFEVRRTQVEEIARGQKGCKYFHISVSPTDENLLFMNDAWIDRESFNGHMASELIQVWNELERKYAYPEQSIFHQLET